jgi:DNA-binding PadR family transcriptional regulator
MRMPKGRYLGEFELYVMAAVSRLGPDAYGMAISREIEARAKRPVAIGAVYATLARLEEKGLVTSSTTEPLPVPGGRSRRLARLTPEGKRALAHTTSMLAQMLPAFAEGRRR